MIGWFIHSGEKIIILWNQNVELKISIRICISICKWITRTKQPNCRKTWSEQHTGNKKCSTITEGSFILLFQYFVLHTHTRKQTNNNTKKKKKLHTYAPEQIPLTLEEAVGKSTQATFSRRKETNWHVNKQTKEGIKKCSIYLFSVDNRGGGYKYRGHCYLLLPLINSIVCLPFTQLTDVLIWMFFSFIRCQ